MPDRTLCGSVVPISAVSPQLTDTLYALYARHYDGVEPDRFRADLAEKRWVLLLREVATGRTVGFSTQMLLDVCVEGQPVRALFSGDTIIDRDYWGSQELVRTWCRFAGQLKARCGARPLYWFLISKGYRTYLYLPYFFETFYPSCAGPTPTFEQQLIAALGVRKYPEAFDLSTGRVEHAGLHDRLKPELDAVPRKLHNPHVAFFVAANPRYGEGVELACVAEIAPANMRSTARMELEVGLAMPDLLEV